MNIKEAKEEGARAADIALRLLQSLQEGGLTPAMSINVLSQALSMMIDATPSKKQRQAVIEAVREFLDMSYDQDDQGLQ